MKLSSGRMTVKLTREMLTNKSVLELLEIMRINGIGDDVLATRLQEIVYAEPHELDYIKEDLIRFMVSSGHWDGRGINPNIFRERLLNAYRDSRNRDRARRKQELSIRKQFSKISVKYVGTESLDGFQLLEKSINH